MATRAQKMQVGLFLVVSVVVIALGFVIMSGVRTKPQIAYAIEFSESILGLSNGSYVVFRGVPVGRVKDITVTRDFLAHVDVALDQTKLPTLREGAYAQLVPYSLAAGTMCITLEGGDPAGPELPAGSLIEVKPSLVKEFSSQIAEFLDSSGEILAKIRDGLKGMHDGDIKRIMDHADELVLETRDLLANTNDAVNSIKVDAVEGVAGFRALTDDLRQLTKDADALVVTVQDKVKPLNLSATESDARALLKNVNELSEKLKKTVDILDAVSKTVVNDTDNVQYSLRNILEQAGETMQSMHDLMESLKQDPSSVVWGKGQPKGGK
ncbi:MAG: MCE family protein [Candidatus Hydrogenedentes bacterium]|nr:MCE family protein [Candidatus Hydrogenedentota bacterium]